ncbi:MAG: O-antigen ligase family protein [Deltaproteobacteria bacterium]|nr:O-antigen ligase family protein [Deltaproteobacteria bacterium]
MTLRERVTLSAGVAALCSAVFLVGGVLRWSQAIVALLVVIALLPQVKSRRVFARVPPLVVALGAAALVSAIQLIPLPQALLDILQPIGNGLREDGAALMGTSPWPSLSLDPPGTLRAVAVLVILIGVAVWALRLSISEKGRYRILATIAAIGGVTAALVALHALAGATRLYGLYEPTHAQPKLLGPLLNDNHLGGFMAICATVAGGLAMYPRQRSILRALWLLVVAACGATTVAGNSRGATLALVAGFLVLAGVRVGQRLFPEEARPRSRSRALTTSLPVVVVVVCTIIVIVYASAGDVSHQLSRTSLDEVSQPNSKFAIWRSAESLLSEAPWLGIGRGAFESAITRVHPASAKATFSHAENEYVQAVVEWGVIGAILIGLAMGWVAVRALRRWRDGPLAAAALAALAAIALQSIVDFGVQMLGLAVPVTALLATLTYGPMKELEGKQVRIAAGVRIAQFASLVLAALLLLGSATTSNAEDHERLTASEEVSLDEIRATIERHPLDYFGYALASQAMYRAGDPDTVRVLNHALRLHPLLAGLHHLAARMLLRGGKPEQAAVEFAATLRASTSPRPVVAEVIARLTPEVAATAIPTEIATLDPMLRLLVEAKAFDIQTRWLKRVLDEHPGSTVACTALYGVAMQREELPALLAASQRCGDVVARDRRVALARVLLQKQRFAEAAREVRDVESWTGTVNEKVNAWFVLCDAHIGMGEWEPAKRCLRRLDVGILPAARRSEVTARLDKIEQARALLPPP